MQSLDAGGEYLPNIEGALQAAVDFLTVRFLTVNAEWLRTELTGVDCNNPAQAGRFAAGKAIRSGATQEVTN